MTTTKASTTTTSDGRNTIRCNNKCATTTRTTTTEKKAAPQPDQENDCAATTTATVAVRRVVGCCRIVGKTNAKKKIRIPTTKARAVRQQRLSRRRRRREQRRSHGFLVSCFVTAWLFVATPATPCHAFVVSSFSCRNNNNHRATTTTKKAIAMATDYNNDQSTASGSLFGDLDPILVSMLLQQTTRRTTVATTTSSRHEYDNDDIPNDPASTAAASTATTNTHASSWDIKQIMDASRGLRAWKSALSRGRLPTETDFLLQQQQQQPVTDENKDDDNNNYGDPISCWPGEPLFSKLSRVMADLQLSRFVLRHPETVPAVLASILRLTIDFCNQKSFRKQQQQQQQRENEQQQQEEEEEWNDFFCYEPSSFSSSPDATAAAAAATRDEKELDSILADAVVASGIADQWGGIIHGVSSLDRLFGSQHGLLNVQQQQPETTSPPSPGFGLTDGVWHHNGWHVLPELQRQVSSMAELRDLVGSLGRRPTAEEKKNTGGRRRRFPPRIPDPDGMLGARSDPAARDSVEGLTLSNSLSEMVPSEAALLKGSYPSLRWLFLAKQAESKLLSYELSGWTDVPSIPQPRPKRFPRMPSAPGGPLVVCLDTSWSMSGSREWLSKAVVLACVGAAHEQKRDCRVVAFSTRNQVVESGLLTADPSGVKRLLDFLQHSFGGGTDVTGALKYAMANIVARRRSKNTDANSNRGNDNNNNKKEEEKGNNSDYNNGGNNKDNEDEDEHRAVDMSSADLLLITDGEIPDPPVSREVVEELEQLKKQTGMEIHGLLVGKKDSPPLTKLCTQTHTFLTQYEGLKNPAAAVQPSSRTAVNPAFGRSSSAATASKATGTGGIDTRKRTIDFSSRSSPFSSSRMNDRKSGRAYDSYAPSSSSSSSSLPQPPPSSLFASLPFPQTRTHHNCCRSNARAVFQSKGNSRLRRRTSTLLHAKYSSTDRSDRKRSRKNSRQGRGGKRRFEEDDDDDGYWDFYNDDDAGDGDNYYGTENGNSEQGGKHHHQRQEGKGEQQPDDFNTRVEEATQALQSAARAILQEQAWTVSDLDEEKERDGSCWPYRNDLRAAVQRVGENLVERDEEARLVVLGMISREHVLFLGPPGTGKSALGRRLSTLCRQANDGDSNGSGGTGSGTTTNFFFQRLLTRFTTPEEIFGPLSLKSLENDEYRRCTAGFLPTASVAFLDEIFKANSAILNTLLTILNERQFDNGAGRREQCPVRCVVGASNELPESDELDALYDRFLLRKEVLPVSDEGLVKMLSMDAPGYSPCDDDDDGNNNNNNEDDKNKTPTPGSSSFPAADDDCDVVFSDGLDRVIDSISAAADRVMVSEDIAVLLRDLRTYMREELDVDVSDRRLVKAARLLKISAACHGRKRVDPIDCLLLQHVVWGLPEQRGDVREWLWDRLTPGGGGGVVRNNNDDRYTDDEEEEETPGPSSSSPSSSSMGAVDQFGFLLNNLRQAAVSAVRQTAGDVTGASGARREDVDVIRCIRGEVSNLSAILQQRSALLSRHIELLNRSLDHLWIDPDEARAAQQLLRPRAERTLKEMEQTLLDARALELALLDHNNNDNDGGNNNAASSPLLPDDLRLSVMESLWNNSEDSSRQQEDVFTEEDMSMGMKEAKAKYDLETFRMWKRARRKQRNKKK